MSAQYTQQAIPSKAPAAVLHKHKGPTTVEDVPVKQPQDLKPNECLIRLTYTGVCHSDLSNANNIYDHPSPLPAIFGHEGAGYVVAIGEGASTTVKVGDRVGVKYIQDACLACEMCMRGHESTCVNGPQMSGATVPGTFQHYIVSFLRYVTPIPEGLDMAEAAPVLCAGVTVLRGLKEARLSTGDWVAIPGAGGGLGHLAVQYAIAHGQRVLGIDTGVEKRKLVEGYGGTFLDFKEAEDLVKAVKDATDGLGPHAAIVSAASEAAYNQARDYLRPRGTLVMLGLPANAELRLPILETALRGLRVVGCFVGNRQDAVEALQLHASGRAKLRYEMTTLDKVDEAYQRLREGKVPGRLVIDMTK